MVAVAIARPAFADPPPSPPPPPSLPPVPSPPPAGSLATPAAAPSPSGAAASPPAPPGATAATPDAPAPAPAVVRLAPVATADEAPAPSDHDAVVGHVGLEASRFDPGPLPLALRPGVSCPAAATNPCTVTMGALRARYWWTRNLGWNVGAAFTVGGGRDQTHALDTNFGLGPVVGLSLLLGNWRHLAIAASPELALVWFSPGETGAGGTTTMVDVRASLEAELHFGFIGVPALSVGLLAGVAMQYESVGDTRLWSVGVIGAQSPWGALTNLFVRYYL